MKTSVFYFIIVFLAPITLFCQMKEIEKAELHFERLEFKEALDNYFRAYNKNKRNITTQKQIALCYFKINDMLNAEKWYKTALKKGTLNNEELLIYTEVLMQNKKYEEVEKKISIYNNQGGASSKINRYKEALLNQKYLLKDSADFKVFPIKEINTPGADFSPCFYQDGIVYVSERNHGNFSNSEFLWDESHFLDYYFIKLDDKSKGTFKSKSDYFRQKVNSGYHEGPLSFNKNESLMAFTRNNYFKGKTSLSKDGTNKLKIFFREKTDGKWGEIKNFEYNNDEYSCGHPALNKKGDVMYFVSDMPGGSGGTDIWMSKFENGIWQKPKNLGDKINTSGNEMFCVLMNDSILVFASNGRVGLGGLDIYITNLNNNREVTVENLGYPINSSKDDFGLITDSTFRYGYFSSNRNGVENGSDDIYFFSRQTSAIPVIVIDNESRKPLPNGKLECVFNTNIKINNTDSNGKYNLTTSDIPLRLKASYNGYSDSTLSLNKAAILKNEVRKIIIPLKKNKYYLNITIIDNETKTPLSHVSVSANFISKPVISELNFITILDKKNMAFLKSYNYGDTVILNTKLSLEGYLSKTELLKNVIGNDTLINVTIGMDKLKKGIDVGKLVSLNPIYFDVDKFDIRNDAAEELDKIVAVMQQNPNIVIELGSHTDCRAPAKYNLTLSDKRAKASAAYIISKGIAKNRIYGKGYGENKLLNKCACEGKKESTCSEEEHQLNRRTEFRIVEIN